MLKIKPIPKEKPNNVNNENGRECTVLVEPYNNFKYHKAGCETVIQGQNNSWIVLGRDRPGDFKSGYGGKGHGNDSSIDIVVGRLSAIDATTIDGMVNPNPQADAARLYLSQKADIDAYYNLAGGRTGQSRGRSAALLKADDIRIVSRNSLKLVTRTDAFCSTNDKVFTTCGVQLIANNDDRDMQPIPKGTNLVAALNDAIEKVVELNGLVKGFMEIQRDFNRIISQHTHYSPFYGSPTSPSPDLIINGKMAEINMNLKVDQGLTGHMISMYNYRSDYILSTGKKYINSSFHFLN